MLAALIVVVAILAFLPGGSASDAGGEQVAAEGNGADKTKAKEGENGEKETGATTEEEAAEADAAAEREANTIRVGNVAFCVPEGWREGMNIERTATGVNISTTSSTWVFSLNADSATYMYIVSSSSPFRTVNLESGWRLDMYYGDDGVAIAELNDSQGNWICEMTTMKYDGNEFGGGSVNPGDGRAGQAAITDFNADADPE